MSPARSSPRPTSACPRRRRSRALIAIATSTAAASAAASAGPRMIVGATTQRMPSASTAARQGGVGLVDHQGGRQRRVEPGHADDRRLVAELAEQAVGRALRARRRRRWATRPRRRRGGPRPRRARRARRAPGRSTRSGSTARSRTRSAVAIASSTPGAGRAARRPSKRTRGHGDGVLPARRSTPGSRSRPRPATVTIVRSGSSVTGSSRSPSAPRRRDLGGHLGQRGARPAAGRCGTGGWPRSRSPRLNHVRAPP